jgi:type VI secretion system secreted protein Hcp
MAIDTFLYFKAASAKGTWPKGETTDAIYKPLNAIEVMSWSWGASNPVTIGSSSAGSGAGKVSISSMNIMKKVDTASPLLFLACCQGDHFDEVHLEVRKAGAADGKAYQIMTMLEVFVESVQESASSEEGTESISLAFGTLQFSYAPQDAKGALGTAIPAGWNAKTNTKV